MYVESCIREQVYNNSDEIVEKGHVQLQNFGNRSDLGSKADLYKSSKSLNKSS